MRQVASAATPRAHVLKVPRGQTVSSTVSRLRHQPGVAYAVPNYIAHVAGDLDPRTIAGAATPPAIGRRCSGISCPPAASTRPRPGRTCAADHRPGGRGVVVASSIPAWRTAIGTSSASRRTSPTRSSSTRTTSWPTTRSRSTARVTARSWPGPWPSRPTTGLGSPGLAYGASIMPVRVLDATAPATPRRSPRESATRSTHGAKVINLSLEFDLSINQGDIPDILSAIRYAHSRGVVVVAASGNEGIGRVAYPARRQAGDLGRCDHEGPVPGRLLKRRRAAVARRSRRRRGLDVHQRSRAATRAAASRTSSR